MAYAVVFVDKQRDIRVFGVRRCYCVVRKMMAKAVLCAAAGKVVGKEQIEMLIWSIERFTLRKYVVLRIARTSCAVVCKVVAKEENVMDKAVAIAKNEMIN